MSERTPGPWTWTICDHSMAILHAGDPLEQPVMAAAPCSACAERAKPDWKWGHCHVPSLADAHLIAAAPELLAAAIELSDVAGEGSEDLPDDTPVKVSIGSRTIITYYLRDFRALNAAIAKAEGAQQAQDEPKGAA